MKHLSTALATAIILGLSASIAVADKFMSWVQTSNQPMDIIADKATFRRTADAGEIRFKGNVKVKQGNMTLRCDRLVTLYDENKRSGNKVPRNKRPKDLRESGKPKSITATGNVRIMQEELKASAGKAVFDSKTRTITLTENPRVWHEPHVMAAHTIVVYLDEYRSEALSKDGDQIRLTVIPEKQQKRRSSREH